MGKHTHTSAKSAALLSVACLVLVALASVLIFTEAQNRTYTASSAVLTQVSAQTQVVIVMSVGGTTEPTSGNYTYPAETIITLKANAAEGFIFETWVIASIHASNVTDTTNPADWSQSTAATNPLMTRCKAEYTYIFQPVFKPATDKAVAALPLGMTQTQATTVVAFLAAVAVAEATALGIIYNKRQRK